MDIAQQFFDACENSKGWEVCSAFVDAEGTFECQSGALADVKTLKAYTEWMKGLGSVTMPGCSYEVHAQAFDEKKNTAIFFATFTGTHSGEGGPVPPTNKTLVSHYVYAIRMNEGKVVHMTKIWNDAFALKQVGWV